MIGKVAIVNRTKTRAGVFVRGYGYSVLLGKELPISIGDEISGNLRDMGSEVLLNKSQNLEFEAFIDDCDQDQETIKQSVYSSR